MIKIQKSKWRIRKWRVRIRKRKCLNTHSVCGRKGLNTHGPGYFVLGKKTMWTEALEYTLPS